MNLFEMVVFIVVIGVIGGVFREYFKSRHRTASISNDSLDEALDRIDDIEERVRVLERVVTDDRFDLKRQIDDLQD